MKNLLYILLILSLASCKLFKESRNESRFNYNKVDSTIRIERVIIDTIRIPAEIIKAEIPVQDLTEGKQYNFRSNEGRASASVKVEKGLVKFDTRCDSLEVYVKQTEIYIERLINQVEKLKELNETKEVVVKPIPFYYKISLWVSIILLLYIGFKAVTQKFTITNK